MTPEALGVSHVRLVLLVYSVCLAGIKFHAIVSNRPSKQTISVDDCGQNQRGVLVPRYVVEYLWGRPLTQSRLNLAQLYFARRHPVEVVLFAVIPGGGVVFIADEVLWWLVLLLVDAYGSIHSICSNYIDIATELLWWSMGA